jgi:cyclopropane-fatty-acyl-phospholipid synthase
MWYTSLLEKNLLSDFVIRAGIRNLLKQRLKDENKGNPEAQQEHLMKLVEDLKASPIAVSTAEANEQHYEVPAEFFTYVMGKHMKYSSGYWKPGVRDIDISERDMLEITSQRAELKDGQKVLELGCGWGSLSLFMAEKFPNSHITGVSNSHSQKVYIDGQAKKSGIRNLTIITSDMNTFQADEKFDRVVSVEMFEHMRNYKLLLKKIFDSLKPDGKLFVHIFTHKTYAYKFEVKDQTDWMSRYFFTGGIMPSDHLLFYFNDHMRVEKHWLVDGTHYSKTSEAWLSNMDNHTAEIMPIMKSVYGEKDAMRWWVYWRIFFMACAELWGYADGKEWFVSHYLFQKAPVA